MFVNSVLRWILFVSFIIGVFGNVDIFDIFNDPIKKKPDIDKVEIKQTTMATVVDQKKNNIAPKSYKTQYQTLLIAYRDVVNYWIKSLPSEDAELYRLILKLSPDAIARLKKFATNVKYDEEDVLRDVHMASQLLQQNTLRIEELIPSYAKLTWLEQLRSLDVEKIILVMLLTSGLGLISIISIQAHHNFRRWVKTFFIFAFTISVFQNCYALYLESLAKIDSVLIKKLPEHCLSYSHGFLHTLKTAITRTVQVSDDTCFEYQKALRSMPHADATLIKGISLTIAQLFTTALGDIGERISAFFAGLMQHVPFISLPIVFAFVGFFLFLFITTRSGYAMTSVFGIFSYHPAVTPDVTKSPIYLELKKDSEAKIRDLEQELKNAMLLLESKSTLPMVSQNSMNRNIPLTDGSSSLTEQQSLVPTQQTNQHADVPSSNQVTNINEQDQDVPSNIPHRSDYRGD